MAEEWITVNTISAELGVSTESIRKYLNKPDGIPATLVGNSYRIKRQDYEDWQRRQQGKKKKT